MSRRTDRVDSVVRRTLGQLLLTRLSDPRIDPARTTVTKVTVSEDLTTAKVYVSVIGSEADQRKALAALTHASGHLQALLIQQVDLRQTPVLNFILDTGFKKALQTLEIIDQAMAEIRAKEQDYPGETDRADQDTRDDA